MSRERLQSNKSRRNGQVAHLLLSFTALRRVVHKTQNILKFVGKNAEIALDGSLNRGVAKKMFGDNININTGSATPIGIQPSKGVRAERLDPRSLGNPIAEIKYAAA